MKRKIFLLFLLALSAIAKVSAQTLEHNSTEMTFLSSDKTRISVVLVTQTTESNAYEKKYTVNTNIVYDTLRVYYPSNEAKKYLTNDLAQVLIFSSNGVVSLPDSLVPRWNHMFGKETYQKRELQIVGDRVFFYLTRVRQTPAKDKSEIWLLLPLSLFFIIIAISGKDKDKVLIRIFCSFSLIFFPVGIFLIKNEGNSILLFLDVLLIFSIILVPGLVASFIKLPKKKKD